MEESEHVHEGIVGGEPIEVPAFLGMTEQQSRLLVALYNETDPEFAKQMPTALPIAAQQLANEYEKRNSVGKKVGYENRQERERETEKDTLIFIA